MRSFMIVVVLSALAACYDAAVLPSEEQMSQVIVFDEKSPNGMVLSRADFNARYGGFVLLSESKDFVPAVEGQEQSITKMRSLMIIVVLSALAACYNAAVLPSEEEMSQVTIVFDEKSPNGMVLSRADFNARYSGFVLLSESKDFVPAVEGEEQSVTKMRSLMIIVVLSALAACYDAAVLQSEEEMSQVIVFDEKSPNGVVLFRADFNARYGSYELVSKSNDFLPAVEGQEQSITKMRSLMIIVVLSALAACYDAAVLQSEEEMSQVIVFDEKSPNGVVLFRADFNARYGSYELVSKSNDFLPAVEGQEQSITKVYRAESDIKINMFVVTTHLSHLPEIIHSSLGKNYVEITLKPERLGEGLHTTLEIYRSA
ncbi:unnamed protein product [Spodoptera exigua]|nr:unnamed protein product [Spodoptera exigua]